MVYCLFYKSMTLPTTSHDAQCSMPPTPAVCSVRLIGALLLSLSAGAPVFASDTTAPTTPVVTDDGAYTASATQLHATWASSDPESGIAEYQYLIQQDSTSGAIIVNWTSTGTTASVTKIGLSLTQGKTYYIQVKARNGAGLWSAIGTSNGIKMETTAPSAPAVPLEGSSSTDLDYDADGAYAIYWTAASDAESGISAYELQERIGTSGAWTTLTNTLTSLSLSVTGRLDKNWYFYHVRAKNGAGLWGPWSLGSDGILVDQTAPSGTVTINSGAGYTNSLSVTLALFATDNCGTVSQMQFSNDGTTYTTPEPYAATKSWTLTAGQGVKTVFVKFKDPTGNWSTAANDSITVDTTPPGVTVTFPVDGSVLGAQ